MASCVSVPWTTHVFFNRIGKRLSGEKSQSPDYCLALKGLYNETGLRSDYSERIGKCIISEILQLLIFSKFIDTHWELLLQH